MKQTHADELMWRAKFAHLMRKWRKHYDHTQGFIAAMLRTTETTIARIERAEVSPTFGLYLRAVQYWTGRDGTETFRVQATDTRPLAFLRDKEDIAAIRALYNKAKAREGQKSAKAPAQRGRDRNRGL